MKDILISNARIVSDGRATEGDVRIRNGRIDAIGSQLSAEGCDVIDARGKVLMPGMIDDQVHFREPGMEYKGGIASESRAAAAGGITTTMEMPNTKPPTTSIDALEAKYALAADKSVTNYAFYLGASNDNIDAIRALDPKQACGVKVFMGASTGNMLVDRVEVLDQIFAESPVLVATHCEDTPTIMENLKMAESQYGREIPIKAHPRIRSEEACFMSSSLAVDLARHHGTRLHVLHISTARELELFTAAPMDGKQITAEACVHFLHFDERDYEFLGNRIKCNPAIKRSEDRIGLIQAIQDGRIDIIATDHAPHTLEEKAGDYFEAPAGLPLVQRAMQVVLEHVHLGHFSLEMVAEKTAHAPARRFQVKDRGYIREGYWADLVLVDLENTETDSDDKVLYKCGWTPFENFTFHSSIYATLVNGQLAWYDGKLQDIPPGMRLEFDR